MTASPSSRHVLVTGGAGFIGSHLAERLLREPDVRQVTILDDLSTGRYANVQHLEADARVRLVIDSVLNESLVDDLVKDADRVFHLASAVGVKLVLEQPVKTIQTIVNGTDVLLRYCARYRKRVLITSSSEVYGKGTTVPFREDDDVVTGSTSKHRWAYACAKALDEFLALAHWRETRLPVVITRLFNTVGPRQTGQYGMVLPRFVGAAVRGEPIVVYDDGEQTRCFAHVLDVVDALARALETSACFGQVINVGSNVEVTINQLAELAVKLSASKSKVEHIPYDQAYAEGFEDMRRRVPSLEKAERLLGYRPRRDLATIVRDVIGEVRSSQPAGER